MRPPVTGHAARRRFMTARRSTVLVIVLFACGCSVFRPLARPFIKPFVVNRINPGFEIPPTSVMVFYVDGLRKDVLEEMAAAGELPLLKRFILDRAASVDNAV